MRPKRGRSGALLILAIGVAALSGSAASAGVATPHLIPLQGEATDTLDTPIVSGDVAVRIYDAAVAGSLVYDSGTEFIGAITDGSFDIELGNITPLTLDNTLPYYMEIDIDGEEVIGDANGSRVIFYPGGGSHDRSDIEARLDSLESALGVGGGAAWGGNRRMAALGFSGSSGDHELRYGLLGIGMAEGNAAGIDLAGNMLLQPVGRYEATLHRLSLGPYYATPPAQRFPRTWHVPTDAPSIQAGIDSAWAGDTVLVACGTYYEHDIALKSGIYLRSQTGEASCVMIDAGSLGRVFYCSDVDTTTSLEGFTSVNGVATDGGGMYCERSSPAVSKCDFLGNSADYGGAVCCTDSSFPALSYCVMSQDSASQEGGALFVSGYSVLTITNCTLTANSAPVGAGLLCEMNSSVTFQNAIVALNTSGQAVQCSTGGSASLSCSDVYGNTGGDWVGCIEGQDTLYNNLHADPLFCDTLGGDFHLCSDSPCAATNNPGCKQIGALGIACGDCGPTPEPAITNIVDVGNDQGRQVSLSWKQSKYDAPGDTVVITGYSVWRRIDDLPGMGLLAYPPGDWHYLLTVPAGGEDTYSCVAPTLCDSTTSGICWSVFFIRAMTPDPLTHFDSEPDSGYSVDNLAPAAPANLVMTSPTALTWDEPQDEDFNYFTVFGSASPGLDSAAVLLEYTIANTADITGDVYDYYHVTATDFSGNEGDASTVENTYTGAVNESLPEAYRLEQNTPNPFNASTVIRFELPEAADVSLKVYSVSGRLVTTLATGEWQAGRHSVSWGGDDGAGNDVGPGIYFVRMEAGEFVALRKMLLLR